MPRALARSLAATAFLLLAGCASTPTTAPSSDLDLAVAAYERGAYDTALEHARAAETGPDGAEAHYVAGLAASQLEQWSDAERALERARRESSDRALRARATAALGLVHLATNRPEDAVPLLAEAQSGLTGIDRTRARDAERAARAAAGLPDAPTGSFTLQVGVFSSRSRAESARDDARRIAQRAGLPAPELLADTDDDGHSIYRVQVGRFTSRDDAARARNRNGLTLWYVRNAD